MTDEPESWCADRHALLIGIAPIIWLVAWWAGAAAVSAQTLESPTTDQLPARAGDANRSAVAGESANAARQEPPLLVLDISERWIAELADRLFDERSQVDLELLGVRMRGTARTEGHYTIRCVDGEGSLCFNIDAEGTSVSSTRGRQGPAVIRSTATTSFRAQKSIELNGRWLVTRPTTVDAEMQQIRSLVNTRLCIGKRLVKRIARQRMRRGRAEIERKTQRRAERRITAAVDRSVEQFRLEANDKLKRLKAQFPWVGWGDEASPVHLETGERMLRLTWRDGGGEMRDPFYLVVGRPEPGLRLWIDRRAFRVESQRLRERWRRMWRGMAMVVPLLPGESSSAPWSAEFHVFPLALQVTVPSAGVMVRVPGPQDPMTAILGATARTILGGPAGSHPIVSDGQNDGAIAPKGRAGGD
jgi:hypothetical protein